MRLYVLSALPLTAAGIVALLGRRRWVGSGLTLVALLVCAGSAAGRLMVEEQTILLGHELVLDSLTRWLLVRIYLGAALLCVWAELGDRACEFGPAALVSVATLTASLLVRPLSMSLLLLPCGLVAAAAVARPHTLTSASGASGWLVWSAVPIPFLLAAFGLLDHQMLYPDETWMVDLAALLSLAPVILWLGLFPVQAATWAWASDGVPLGPALTWVARDTVVLYLLLALWQQHPELGTTTALALLGMVGLFSAVTSGILAGVQHSAGGVLACGMAGVVGTAAVGLASGSPGGWQGALVLLAGRWVVAYLAIAALTVMDVCPAPAGNDRSIQSSWPRWAGIAGLAVAILSLVGALPGAGFWGRQQVFLALGDQFRALWLPWALASLGPVIGLVRILPTLATSGSGRRGRERAPLAVLLLCGLLPVAGYIAALPLQLLQNIPIAFHTIPFHLTR